MTFDTVGSTVKIFPFEYMCVHAAAPPCESELEIYVVCPHQLWSTSLFGKGSFIERKTRGFCQAGWNIAKSVRLSLIL